MNKEKKEEIIELLAKKGAVLPCPRCSNRTFVFIDGYLNQSLQKEVSSGMIIGGPSLPSVATICDKCGFISQHALGALNLLPSKRKEGE